MTNQLLAPLQYYCVLLVLSGITGASICPCMCCLLVRRSFHRPGHLPSLRGGEECQAHGNSKASQAAYLLWWDPLHPQSMSSCFLVSLRRGGSSLAWQGRTACPLATYFHCVSWFIPLADAIGFTWYCQWLSCWSRKGICSLQLPSVAKLVVRKIPGLSHIFLLVEWL